MVKKYYFISEVKQYAKINEMVEISGWCGQIRNLGSIIFLILTDHTGQIQICIPKSNNNFSDIASITSESALTVHGIIQQKKGVKKQTNSHEIIEKELLLTEIKVENASYNLPFLSSSQNVLEKTQLQYRYLFLRDKNNAYYLYQRDKIIKLTRLFFSNWNFAEIETPILSPLTVEGAGVFSTNDYLNNKFSLAQSPQLYKQFLIASGFKRYFQIAKCFRNEKLRSNRQYEFTQLDLEVAFTDEDYIFSVINKYLAFLFKEIKCSSYTITKMTYSTAIDDYGTDQPDIRFDGKIQTAKSDSLKSCTRFIKISNKFLNDVKQFITNIKSYSGFEEFKNSENLKLQYISNPDKKTFFLECSGSSYFDISVFLGFIRLQLQSNFNCFSPKNDYGEFAFVWITNFPFYCISENKISTMHHPFTAIKNWPKDNNLVVSLKNFRNYTSLSYDIVLNGQEIGSGSIRNHIADQQYKIFKSIGLSKKDIISYFGNFLKALASGTPPHGGIALGMDRLISIILNCKSIRDVIAFPKNTSGKEPLFSNSNSD